MVQAIHPANVEPASELELNGRRRAFINALRSGRYRQANGVLFLQNHAKLGPAYCCIGVGRVCQDPATLEFWTTMSPINAQNDNKDYTWFKRFYGVENERLVPRLVALNDGMGIPRRRDDNPGGEIVGHVRKNIRRDFAFTARFLEMIWFGGKS